MVHNIIPKKKILFNIIVIFPIFKLNTNIIEKSAFHHIVTVHEHKYKEKERQKRGILPLGKQDTKMIEKKQKGSHKKEKGNDSIRKDRGIRKTTIEVQKGIQSEGDKDID